MKPLGHLRAGGPGKPTLACPKGASALLAIPAPPLSTIPGGGGVQNKVLSSQSDFNSLVFGLHNNLVNLTIVNNYPAPAVYSTPLGPHSWTWAGFGCGFLASSVLLLVEAYCARFECFL